MEKYLRYETEFKIVPSSIKKLNPQFSLCDILVCYHGDNRNRTSISKKVIEDNVYSLFGVPIVGEWASKIDDYNEKTWQGHGGKLVIDDNGIHYEQTTKPYGFVTEEAVNNASWVEILEKDGHTKNEYLKLEGCILWTGRYEECNSLLDKNFGQSMELIIEDGKYREDGYFDINKMIFSALCILGDEHPPCFESSSIGRHYEINQFKAEFQLMLDELKKYTKPIKEDYIRMKEKILSILSTYKFKNQCETEANKYAFISMTENEINVFDREDNYKAYTIKFSVAEDESVTIDFEHKIEKSIDVANKTNEEFSLKSEIDTVTSETVSFAVKAYEVSAVAEISEKYEKLKGDYHLLVKENDNVKSKLSEFEQAKNDAEKELHKTEVNNVVEEFSKKMGSYPEFLVYRSKVDYSKTTEQVKTDLLLMLGKANMNKKSSFSYQPTVCGTLDNSDIDANNGNGRYGNLFDKIKKQ